MLMVTWSVTSGDTRMGSVATAWRIRSATVRPKNGLQLGRMMANSSPP